MKEILSHLLADAEARFLVSDSFPEMHINNKINVSVKAMCRVAAKKLYRVCHVVIIINTQMVAVALGPWASHSEDRAEP